MGRCTLPCGCLCMCVHKCISVCTWGKAHVILKQLYKVGYNYYPLLHMWKQNLKWLRNLVKGTYLLCSGIDTQNHACQMSSSLAFNNNPALLLVLFFLPHGSYLGTGFSLSSGSKVLQILWHSSHWEVGSVSPFFPPGLACDRFDKGTVMQWCWGSSSTPLGKDGQLALWPPGALSLRGPCCVEAPAHHVERPYGEREHCLTCPWLFGPRCTSHFSFDPSFQGTAVSLSCHGLFWCLTSRLIKYNNKTVSNCSVLA